jgi:hypothetical protein
MRGDEEAYVYAIIPLYVIILLVAVAGRALLLGDIAWCRENFW